MPQDEDMPPDSHLLYRMPCWFGLLHYPAFGRDGSWFHNGSSCLRPSPLPVLPPAPVTYAEVSPRISHLLSGIPNSLTQSGFTAQISVTL